MINTEAQKPKDQTFDPSALQRILEAMKNEHFELRNFERILYWNSSLDAWLVYDVSRLIYRGASLLDALKALT